jgi:hypothetical protein
VSIYFGWKSMEKLIGASSLKDAGFGFMGLLGSPFMGYIFANIVNGLIPTPSTTPIQLIPSIAPFTYSPPSLSIATPTEKPYPSVGAPSPAPAIVTEKGLPYDITTPITLTYDSTVLSSDKTASISLTYEYQVA